MDLLRAYHATLGRMVDEYGGTLEHFAGDGVMIFFNDPIEVDKPAERAIRMALALQKAFRPISDAWEKLGHEVGLGIGIAQGETTLGVIGFEQRWEYAAIGNVPNLAARLCGSAHAGEIILDGQTEQDIVRHRRHRVRRRADPARLSAAGAGLPLEGVEALAFCSVLGAARSLHVGKLHAFDAQVAPPQWLLLIVEILRRPQRAAAVEMRNVGTLADAEIHGAWTSPPSAVIRRSSTAKVAKRLSGW